MQLQASTAAIFNIAKLKDGTPTNGRLKGTFPLWMRVTIVPQNNRTVRELRIPRVAIVGSGFVGSTTAYALLNSGMAAEIVRIDRDRRRAEGHVQDLRDAEVFSDATRVFAGEFGDCYSADVTIISAGVSQSGPKSRLEGLKETAVILLKETAVILKGLVQNISRHNPHGILLIASAIQSMS